MNSASAKLRVDAGSFRDPSGKIFLSGERVFRTVMPVALDDFAFVRSTGLIDRLISAGKVVAEKETSSRELEGVDPNAALVLEHPRLPFISYPYEWPFPALKAAALLQLDIHLEALSCGVTLSDASAFNIQFQGPQPIFIDSLSFRRYSDGEYWTGHRQFCEQFVNPLLLKSGLGIDFNAWYRGSLEGVSARDLSRLLPWWKKLSWNVLAHVVLQASFQSRANSQERAQTRMTSRKFPRNAFERMLRGLRNWIAKLEPARAGNSVWGSYATSHSYSDDEAASKKSLIAEFAAATRPGMLWDIGCNTGDYSRAALEAGSGYVVGFDSDHGALDAAFARAREERLNMLPLYLDVANPAPSQGWAESERKGLGQRANADAVLALALVHHLAISRNVPLAEVIGWIVSLAPSGVIEFVPKSDPMVQSLLQLRADIFDDYTREHFEKSLAARTEIVKSIQVSATGRRLYWYSRR